MILLPSASRTVATSIVASLAAALAGVACASEGAPASPPAACDGVELLVAASDYSSSMVCGAPRCEAGPRTAGVDLGKDPQLSTSNGRAFFLARDNDLVFELDAACGTPTRRYSVHDDAARGTANPHDVAAARDGSLFVTLYNVPRIAILGEGAPQPAIDLAGYDDDDGNPQAESIRIVPVSGVEKAFVTLQRLDDKNGLRSTRTSTMLRIDVATRQVEAAIELAGRNPFNTMAEHEGALFLAEPGNFDTDDDALAGIERFETATSTTRLLVPESALGGSVAEVAVTAGCGVAIVAGTQKDVNPTSLVSFDPATGAVLTSPSAAVLGPTPGYDLQGLAWRGSLLYVGDRRSDASGFRVHVFEREAGTCNLREVAGGFDLPQRPVALRAAL